MSNKEHILPQTEDGYPDPYAGPTLQPGTVPTSEEPTEYNMSAKEDEEHDKMLMES